MKKLNLLKEILTVPTTTDQEHPMVEWLVSHVIHYIPGATVTVDEHRNVYVSKGSGAALPCVAAHIDTVQPHRMVKISQDGTRLIGHDDRHGHPNCGNQCGIGADDKTGVFVCLELLKRFKNIRAIFFAGEECGTIGARKADAANFDGISYLIEWDCPSRNMVSYTCGGERLFANDGDFIKAAHPVLERYGSNLWQHHPYTDVMTVRRRFAISCLNLSSGYYNWHAPSEFVSIPDVELALELGHDLVKTLGNSAHPLPPNYTEKEFHDGEPLVKVGGLHVPPAAP